MLCRTFQCLIDIADGHTCGGTFPHGLGRVRPQTLCQFPIRSTLPDSLCKRLEQWTPIRLIVERGGDEAALTTRPGEAERPGLSYRLATGVVGGHRLASLGERLLGFAAGRDHAPLADNQLGFPGLGADERAVLQWAYGWLPPDIGRASAAQLAVPEAADLACHRRRV